MGARLTGRLGQQASRLIRPGPHWPPRLCCYCPRARTMRALSGPRLMLCGLLLLLFQAPCALGLAPLSRGEGAPCEVGDTGH